MALLVVSYVFKYYFYTNEIESIKSQYKKEFLASFPGLKKKYRKDNITFAKLRSDAERHLKGGISEKQGAIAEFQLANSGSGALKVLHAISSAIPEKTKIDVTLFDFKTTFPGSGKLVLKAETDNFSSQAAILEALSQIPLLQEVEEKNSGAKPGSDGKVIEFTVHAKYQAT